MPVAAHGFGWKPDLPDVRDYPFAAPRPLVETLPSQVDLRGRCSPVRDQGSTSSCTGFAIAAALEFHTASKSFSPLFIYWQERAIEHSTAIDGGASIRDGIKACAKVGACIEKDWPFAESRVLKRPSARACQDAAHRKIQRYQRVNSLDGVRLSLAGGSPVVFGFSVYESFESDEVARTGVAPLPGQNERLLGGHAVLCVGYSDSDRRITCKNSWGPSFGMAGYFTLDYEYVTNPSLSDDYWQITK